MILFNLGNMFLFFIFIKMKDWSLSKVKYREYRWKEIELGMMFKVFICFRNVFCNKCSKKRKLKICLYLFSFLLGVVYIIVVLYLDSFKSKIYFIIDFKINWIVIKFTVLRFLSYFLFMNLVLCYLFSNLVKLFVLWNYIFLWFNVKL